jgi:Flp pilus assembly protein CpaB
VRTRAIVELVLAAAAGAGCVVAWLAARRPSVAPPIMPGQPETPVLTYSAPLVVLALLLATLAGVLIVFGVAHLRRR